MISRQALRPDLGSKTQSPEMLHGARLGRIGLRVECGAGFGIDQQSPHTTPAQLNGQHQAKGPTPCDQHIDHPRLCRTTRGYCRIIPRHVHLRLHPW